MLSSLYGLLGLVLVSALWGLTNPALEQQSKRPKATDSVSSVSRSQRLTSDPRPDSLRHLESVFRDLARYFSNWRFLAAFGVNQLGSILYMSLLPHCELSIAIPTTAALTFAATAIAQQTLYKDSSPNASGVGLSPRSCIGMILIAAGTAIALINESTSGDDTVVDVR